MSFLVIALAICLVMPPLAVVCVLLGCQSAPSLPPDCSLRSRCGVRLRGEFIAQDIERIDKILGALPPAMIRCVGSISLVQDPDHFESEKQIGHCHCTNDICIKARKEFKPDFIEDVLWHEMGHAYHNYLKCQNVDFDAEWRKLAVNVYCKDYVASDPSYPKDGILTGYGSQSYAEDIAVYVEIIHRALTGRQDAYLAFLIRALRQNDNRYLAKIKLLGKYGFISRADYFTLANLDLRK